MEDEFDYAHIHADGSITRGTNKMSSIGMAMAEHPWAKPGDLRASIDYADRADSIAMMKADGIALQSQAGGFTYGSNQAIDHRPNVMTAAEVKAKLEARGAGYVGNVFRDATINPNPYAEVLSLRAKIMQQEADIKRLCTDMAILAACNAKLQAEITKLKAEKQTFIDAFLADTQPSKLTRDISRAISNYDNASTKMGLPLHDRY